MKKKQTSESGKVNIIALIVYTILVVLVVFFITKNTEKKQVILPVSSRVPLTVISGLKDVDWTGTIQTNTVKKTAFPVADSNLVEAVGMYPVNTPFFEKAEKHSKDFVQDFITDYSDINALTQSYSVSAEASVDVFFGKKLMSYLYKDWRDDGGAHGNSVFSSETFDMTGKKYILADLFLKDAEYLGIISRLAISHFSKDPEVNFDISDSSFGSGLDPKLENFQTFAVSTSSLIFQFQNYQIGPYSEGAQRFEISINNPEIKNIVRPELFGL